MRHVDDRVQIHIARDLAGRIDTAKGLASRARYVRYLLELALDIVEAR